MKTYRVFLLCLICCAIPAFGQNPVRWDLGAPGGAGVTTVSGNGLPQLLAVPNVGLNWCNYPANAVPCSNFAVTYTSLVLGVPCPSNAQIVLQGSSTCQATGDASGNLGVYTTANTYSYTLTIGSASYGPYTVTLASGGGGGGGTAVGPQGALQFFDLGIFNGSANMVWDKVANQLTVGVAGGPQSGVQIANGPLAGSGGVAVDIGALATSGNSISSQTLNFHAFTSTGIPISQAFVLDPAGGFTLPKLSISSLLTVPSGTLPVTDLHAGNNGQCLLTSSGVTWGNCSGTNNIVNKTLLGLGAIGNAFTDIAAFGNLFATTFYGYQCNLGWTSSTNTGSINYVTAVTGGDASLLFSEQHARFYTNLTGSSVDGFTLSTSIGNTNVATCTGGTYCEAQLSGAFETDASGASETFHIQLKGSATNTITLLGMYCSLYD